ADTLIYTTEKSMRDLGDKVDAELRATIDEKAEALKKVMEGEDPEAIKQATDELAQASHKLAEKLYAQKTAEEGAGPEAGAEAGEGAQAGTESEEEDVVDADYTEVK
ncbi:MAG: Hsp70 family protein, partial [Desulfohalobiaceae bacterium]